MILLWRIKNKYRMKRGILYIVTLLLLLSGCSRSPRFKIEGNVSNADGKMLYLELFGLDSTHVIDSVKLNKKGNFHFSIKVADAPEFYRLRIDRRFIHLCADSARTITINANEESFGKSYTVKGSKCCELIRQLSMLQGKTLIKSDSIKSLYDKKIITADEYRNALFELFSGHRNQTKTIIYEDPRSPAAYFALFQRFHDYLVFDPYDKNDNKVYAAVATAWDTYWHNAPRTKHLVNLTLIGLKEIRKERDARDIKITETDESSHFNISLPDINGREIELSSLKGKVVLLDFTAYQASFSPSRNLSLRELYNKYSKKGFTIYQISLDNDEHFWKTSAVNLPWICVRDREGANSKYLVTFNVNKIPTYFIVNREGNIIARDVQISDLRNEIEKLL